MGVPKKAAFVGDNFQSKIIKKTIEIMTKSLNWDYLPLLKFFFFFFSNSSMALPSPVVHNNCPSLNGL